MADQAMLLYKQHKGSIWIDVLVQGLIIQLANNFVLTYSRIIRLGWLHWLNIYYIKIQLIYQQYKHLAEILSIWDFSYIFFCFLITNYQSNIMNQIKQYQQIQQMIDWIKKATGKNTIGNPRFHVKTEPEYFDISSTVTVTAFTDTTETALLPCHYKWYKIRNGLKQQTNKFKGSSYVCDSSDLGAIIQADVISNDSEYSGQVTVSFGPIKLTGELKKSIMDTLINGSYTIKACIVNGEVQQKQCQFKIFEDMVKIIHQPTELNFSFNYTTYEPRIQGFSKDSTKILITFLQNQGNAKLFLKNLFGIQYDQLNRNCNGETVMQVKFASKQQKQWFLLTLKAFYTKKNLKNSVIIRKIEQSSFKQNQDINLLMEIESLRSDLLKALSMSDQKQKEKTRLAEQVRRLQKQIEQIISTYQKIIDERVKNTKEFNDSYTHFNNKKDDIFGRKCENLQKQNVNLNQRIRMLTAEIDQIRFNTSIVKKNQTVYPPNNNIPNMTHITSIRMNQPYAREATTFQNILQQLSESRVTQYNQQSIRLGQQIDRVNEQKAQLEKKLQKSFRTIDQLQKKIKNPQAHTVINFNRPDINTSNYSLSVDLDRAKQENSKLKIMNDNLKAENKNLQNEIKNVSSGSRIIIKPNNSKSGQTSRIIVNQQRQKQMNRQIQNLKREIADLSQKLTNQEIKNEKLLREKLVLERKVTDLGRELQMYKKNQEVLNRSQYLSMEMENYNEEKMKVLKDQNDFLLTQNEKLTKACEKYMNEARQNIQLRKEILQLKQKTGAKFLNPEKQANSILLSPLNRSEYSDIISRKI